MRPWLRLWLVGPFLVPGFGVRTSAEYKRTTLMQQQLSSAFVDNFLGNSPTWYKLTIIGFLILNPILLATVGPFVTGWVLIIEFIFTLAMALKCYPLQPGGLLAIEAVIIGHSRGGKAALCAGIYDERGGWFTSAAGNAIEQENYQLRGTLTWEPNDNWSFLLKGERYDQKRFNETSEFVQCSANITPLGLNHCNADPEATLNDQNYRGGSATERR